MDCTDINDNPFNFVELWLQGHTFKAWCFLTLQHHDSKKGEKVCIF